MTKFDLRKHLPFLGAMGVLNNSRKNQEESTDSIDTVEKLINNLEVRASIEYKNEEIYNRILNDLVEEYGADNDTEIIETELEKMYIKNVEKFLETWKYLLIKYKQFIFEYEHIEIVLVDSVMSYIAKYDEDKEKQIKTYKFIEESEEIKDILFGNKYVHGKTTNETLSVLLYENKYYKLFKELLELVYTNRKKYLEFDFNQLTKDLIEARYYKKTSEGLNILKEELKRKEMPEEINIALEKQYLEVLKDEETEREYLGINEETNEIEYVKIVGIDYEERRKVFEKLSIGKEVFFIREKDNKYDKNAIRVVNGDNETVGYVERKNVQPIAKKMDCGRKCKIYVTGFYTNKFLAEVVWQCL